MNEIIDFWQPEKAFSNLGAKVRVWTWKISKNGNKIAPIPVWLNTDSRGPETREKKEVEKDKKG